MIGHSFGARALVAMFRTPWEHRKYHAPPVSDSEFSFHGTDRLILLEGAFNISQLFKDENLLPTLENTSLPITMTSSQIDTAFDLAIWGNYVGDTRTFASVCGTPPSHVPIKAVGAFRCDEATGPSWGLGLCNTIASSPIADTARKLADAKIRYFDASKLINCQTPFGGGGAHDDFNRPEMGRFLWSEIQARP